MRSVIRNWQPELWFALVCFLGSAGTVQKYAGTAATAAYFVLVLVAVPLAARKLLLTVTPRTVLVLAVVTLLVLAVLYTLIYPHANTHNGTGTDRDDNADNGARAILHGVWPYDQHSYLGGTISQFPGLLLLAIPFVALGHSAYAAFFWLPLLFLLLWRTTVEPRTPLVLLWIAFVASPVVVREIVTGGDLIANTVSVMLAVWLVLAALERRSRALVIVAGLALGLTLSSRLNFLFVLVPLLVAVGRRAGARAVVAVTALAFAGFAAVTLPFYIGHSTNFPPLESDENIFAPLARHVPGAYWMVFVAAAAVALALALRISSSTLASVFAQAATLQALFLIGLVACDSVIKHSFYFVRLFDSGYGVTVVLFTLGAVPIRECLAGDRANRAGS